MHPVIVWTYHRVMPTRSNATVTAEVFERQLSWLSQAGYNFIDTEGLRLWFDGSLDRKQKYAMLTFDDGWADNLIWATPILKRFNARAVMAVNTSLINLIERDFKIEDQAEKFQIIDSKKALGDAVYNRDRSSFLTWQELERIKDSGLWDIQAHGNSHLGCYKSLEHIRGFYPHEFHWTMEYALGMPPFKGAPRADFQSNLSIPRTVLANDLIDSLREAEDDHKRFELCRKHPSPIKTVEPEDKFIARIRADMQECKSKLSQNLGVNSSCFFWPWGHDSQISRDAAADCGFELLFSMDKGVIKPSTRLNKLPRVATPDSYLKFRKQELVFTNTLLRGFRKIFTRH